MDGEMKLLNGKMHPVTRHAYEMHRVLASALGQLFTRAEAQWQTDLVGSLASCGWVSVDDQLPPNDLPVYAIDRNDPMFQHVLTFGCVLMYHHDVRDWYDRNGNCGYIVTDWHTLPPF